jgi:hypothetical protein
MHSAILPMSSIWLTFRRGREENMMSELALPKRTTDVLGKRMAFFEHGRGTPIVLLHGNPIRGQRRIASRPIAST